MAYSFRFRALTTKLPKFNLGRLEKDLGDVQDGHVEWIREQLSAEPPKKAGSRYVRTHDLSTSWEIKGPVRNPSGLITRLSNPMPYARFVHGTNPPTQGLPLGAPYDFTLTGWKVLADWLDRRVYREDVMSVYRRVAASANRA
jgi:hypothetical protein